jgi:hypothetical protein
VDESQLVGLKGVVKISHIVCNGASLLTCSSLFFFGTKIEDGFQEYHGLSRVKP